MTMHLTACLSTNGPSQHHTSDAPTRLLVATLNGLDVLVRDKSGAAWTRAGHKLDGNHVSSLMKPPGDAGIFAGIHNGGIFHSTDEGETWTPRDAGMTCGHVFSLAFNQHAKGVTLYAGTEPASLFRSDDNGASWRELPGIKSAPGHESWTFPPPPHLAHTKNYLFDANDPDTFYVGIEQGALLKTTDGGNSWRDLDKGFWKPDDVWPKDVHRVPPRSSQSGERSRQSRAVRVRRVRASRRVRVDTRAHGVTRIDAGRHLVAPACEA